jgi:cytochrome o ubiquinol oxidase subunit 1
VVHNLDAWWEMKARGFQRPVQGYKPIHMPKNTATGVILGVVSIAFSFAMIWYIWWLAALTFVAALAIAIGHTFNYDRDFYIPAETVRRTEQQRTEALAAVRA